MAHTFGEVVTKEDIVVDATMGNGHDTFFWLNWPEASLCFYSGAGRGKDPPAFGKLAWTSLS